MGFQFGVQLAVGGDAIQGLPISKPCEIRPYDIIRRHQIEQIFVDDGNESHVRNL